MGPDRLVGHADERDAVGAATASTSGQVLDQAVGLVPPFPEELPVYDYDNQPADDWWDDDDPTGWGRSPLNAAEWRLDENNEDDEGLFPFAVRYVEATCDCGQVHAAVTPCVCGEPCGFDPEFERRRRLATSAFDAVLAADPPGEAGDVDPLTWLPRVAGWFSSFLSACQLVADEETTRAEPLTAALLEIVTLAADVAATPRYRPHLGVWSNIDRALVAFIDVADAYLRALTDSEKAGIEAAGDDGQAAMDAYIAERDAMLAREAAWKALGDLAEDGPFDPLVEMIELVHAQSGATGLLDLDAAGQVFVEQVTGGTPLPSLGIGFAVLDAQAVVLADPSRLWAMAKVTFDTLQRSGSMFVEVVGSASWRSDYEELLAELVDAGTELRYAQFQTPRLAARTLVRLGHILTERVGKYLLATVLAARGGRDYEQLRGFDVGQLLTEAGQVHLGHLALGWDKALRHGDAHKFFEVTDDGVRFTAAQREYDFLTWDELGDRVLAGYESVLAVHAGIQTALEVAGLDVVDALTFLDADVPDTARICLALQGWTDITAEHTDGVLEVSAVVPVEPEAPTFVAALTPYLPEEVHAARFALTTPAGTSLWEGPLEPLRVFSAETDPDAKIARWLAVAARWSVDGEPFFPPVHVRGVMASQFLNVGDDPTARLALLEPLSELARSLRDRAAVTVLADLASGCRAQRYGRDPSRAYHRAAVTLVAWFEAAQDAA